MNNPLSTVIQKLEKEHEALNKMAKSYKEKGMSLYAEMCNDRCEGLMFAINLLRSPEVSEDFIRFAGDSYNAGHEHAIEGEFGAVPNKFPDYETFLSQLREMLKSKTDE